jgi:hypothetical protein
MERSKVDGVAIVSDPLTKAAHYRERADECFELAAIAGDDQIRVHYKQLAEKLFDAGRRGTWRCQPQATSLGERSRWAWRELNSCSSPCSEDRLRHCDRNFTQKTDC